MRNFFLLAAIILSTSLYAQPQGYKTVDDSKSFQSALNNANRSLTNIASDFRQVKNMTLLSEKIRSSGKFYFMKEDKVRIEYTVPYYYLMVMNGNKMLVKDEQKTSRINTGNSKMMQSVNRVMADCMRGTVFTNPDFKTTVYQGAKQFLLSLTPVSIEMGKLFTRIDVYLDKSSFDVARLVLTEKGGDYTDMDFFNTKRNTTLNETLFKVK